MKLQKHKRATNSLNIPKSMKSFIDYNTNEIFSFPSYVKYNLWGT